jgi:hypothetical protein
MPKVKISEFSSTAGNNTDINSINIAEGCAPSGINDAIRTLMAYLKDWQSGAVAQDNSFNGAVTVSGATVLSSTLSVSGAQTNSGNLTLNGQGDLRLADSDSSNWVAFQAPATVASNVTWTLPAADGSNGQVLGTNGSGTLAWVTSASGDVTTTGTQTLTNKTLTDPTIIGTIIEDVFTITDGAAFEIDPANGSIQLITLGANRTPKATNFVAGESVTLMVDDGTAYTLTWTDATFGGSGVVWKTDSGSAPTLNTTGYTVIVLWKVSTQVYGARVGNA